jgi:hypothetical protein
MIVHKEFNSKYSTSILRNKESKGKNSFYVSETRKPIYIVGDTKVKEV